MSKRGLCQQETSMWFSHRPLGVESTFHFLFDIFIINKRHSCGLYPKLLVMVLAKSGVEITSKFLVVSRTT